MIHDAVALVGCSLHVVMAVSAFLSAIEPHPPIQLLFESFSAFGTVGLSMGGRPSFLRLVSPHMRR